jgi:D-glucosaminate-6-phosphate ammonia-lyase
VLSDKTAAALYVVSHHVVDYGQIPLKRFAEICHAKNVPVIVDAASEYDLRRFLDQGADIVIYSGHKFLGGPTSGIIMGRRELVRAAYLQNMGIGRGMKVGKESIMGTIVALEVWKTRDHDGIRRTEKEALTLWETALLGIDGVTPRIVPDPTQNPLDRLQVEIDATKTGWSAAQAAAALGARSPSIVVRNHEVEHNYFQMDPCNLLPGQAALVAFAVAEVLTSDTLPNASSDARNGGVKSYLSWLG